MNAKKSLHNFLNDHYFLIIIISMTLGLRTLEIFLSSITNYQINEEAYLSKSIFEALFIMLFSHIKFVFKAITLYDYSLPVNLIIKQKTFRMNNSSIKANINSFSQFKEDNNEEYLLLDFENSISIINIKSSNMIDTSNKYLKGNSNSSQRDFFNLLIEYIIMIIHYILDKILNFINLFGLLDDKLSHIENYHYLKNLNEYIKYLIAQEDKSEKINTNKSFNSNLSSYKKIPEIIVSRFLEKVKSYTTETEDLMNFVSHEKEKESMSKVFFRTLLLITGEIRTNYFLSQETNPTILLLSVEALFNYYKLQLKEIKNSQDFDFSKLEKITQSYEFLVRIF